MKLKTLSIFGAMALLGAMIAHAAPATKGATLGEWTMDVEAAKALAAKTHKPIFMNFTGSDWCGWCKMMDKKIFSQADWQTYAKENLVLVWVDFPRNKGLVPEAFRERNDALAKQYSVRGYPTYIVLAADGETVLGQLGADAEVTPKGYTEKVARVLIGAELDKWLSAKEMATVKQLEADMKALEKDVDAWQEKLQAEAKAFQERKEKIESARNALLEKAVKASKK